MEGWFRPIFTTLLHHRPTFPRSDGSVYASPCLCAPVTPLNSAASERESLQGAGERGPLSRIWAMTASSSAPTTLVSLCPEPSISEIPPYHCQDMPAAYPPPSIKFLPPAGRFSHRKWFHLKGCVLDAAGLCTGLDADCNLGSTSRSCQTSTTFALSDLKCT